MGSAFTLKSSVTRRSMDAARTKIRCVGGKIRSWNNGFVFENNPNDSMLTRFVRQNEMNNEIFVLALLDCASVDIYFHQTPYAADPIKTKKSPIINWASVSRHKSWRLNNGEIQTEVWQIFGSSERGRQFLSNTITTTSYRANDGTRSSIFTTSDSKALRRIIRQSSAVFQHPPQCRPPCPARPAIGPVVPTVPALACTCLGPGLPGRRRLALAISLLDERLRRCSL